MKVVAFEHIEEKRYNLGFGDYDFSTQTVNDKIVSDNGDSEKVLATVLGILNEFLLKYPDYEVFIVGSSESRTRLYQIAINVYYEEFMAHYQIFGERNGVIESFEKNKKYESFLIRKLF
ncbi:MAG: hypothetical protein EAZ32_00370 [Cytophagia bacterium]|nr:MAG: hypothetical protein EAZ32_00370 [Cytophagia bacterium]